MGHLHLGRNDEMGVVRMIFDQRHMYGVADLHGVREHIATFLAAKGKTPVPDERSLAAYVNHGRWVADCPECAGGIACSPDNPEACCLDCGHTYAVSFPKPKDVARAEAALAGRGARRNQNWHPDAESVKRLEAETALLEGAVK